MKIIPLILIISLLLGHEANAYLFIYMKTEPVFVRAFPAKTPEQELPPTQLKPTLTLNLVIAIASIITATASSIILCYYQSGWVLRKNIRLLKDKISQQKKLLKSKIKRTIQNEISFLHYYFR